MKSAKCVTPCPPCGFSTWVGRPTCQDSHSLKILYGNFSHDLRVREVCSAMGLKTPLLFSKHLWDQAIDYEWRTEGPPAFGLTQRAGFIQCNSRVFLWVTVTFRVITNMFLFLGYENRNQQPLSNPPPQRGRPKEHFSETVAPAPAVRCGSARRSLWIVFTVMMLLYRSYRLFS